MTRQLITFTLGRESFGLDVMVIREIRAWTPTTRLPHAPPFITGVLNLRGVVLPVLDLSARIGWAPTEVDERHAIIVAEIGSQLCGLIVDAVSDILTIQDGELLPPPTGATLPGHATFLEGVVTKDDKLVMIIDCTELSADVPQQLAA